MVATRPRRLSLPGTARIALCGLSAAVAIALVWLSVSVHLERECVIHDTPYLPLCTDAADEPVREREQRLRARLAANPGDSASWVLLTNLETGPYEQALFNAASVLAPSDPNVLMWRAGQALAANDLPRATKLLVDLVEFRRKAEAAETLAQILASGQGTVLLRPYLPSAHLWLPQVLASLKPLKLPFGSALPLVSEAAAKGQVGPEVVRTYIRDLKLAGEWGDAYALWLAQQKGPVPLLHNGSFDAPIRGDGFDWEVTPALASRAGALVGQRASGSRKQVLDVQFTGKPISLPVLRQYVFLAPGQYLLRGQYMISKFRSEQGLAWTARCQNQKGAGAIAGRSEALLPASSEWLAFQFSITVRPGCGQVVSVELEPFAAYEASTGIKGRAAFDALEILATGT